jgi:N-acetylmuramoyl-L-alanine amidase
MSTVVVDAGHGGNAIVGNSSNNNATGPSGTKETDIALDIVLRIAEVLHGMGINVLLTRNSDVNLDLKDRAAVAANNNAEAFLSVHFNGSTDPSIQGSETWVHTGSTGDSRLLAAAVQQRLVGATGYADRGVRSKGLGVLSLAHQSPATACCLVEISFLTNATDENRLQGVTYKNSLASALATALRDFLNQSTGLEPANPLPDGDPNLDADG